MDAEDSVLLRKNGLFGALTTFGTGGRAALWSRPNSIVQLREAMRYADSNALAVWVMGDGSNTVVADTGFPGLVVRPEFNELEFHCSGTAADVSQSKPPGSVYAGAGVPWDQLVERAVDRDLAGIECLSGIPGSVGAAPVQNIGAYGQQLSDVLVFVDAFDRHSETLVRIEAAKCGFGYRTSRFKTHDEGRFVITGVALELRPSGSPTLGYRDLQARFSGCKPPGLVETRTAVLEIRRKKSMVFDPEDPDSRGAGSFFVNPIVEKSVLRRVLAKSGDPSSVPAWELADGTHKLAAAWLIEHAGINRGYRLRSARISSKHTLALVSDVGGTTNDIVALARHVRERVRHHWGIVLDAEPRFVGFDHHPLLLPARTTT